MAHPNFKALRDLQNSANDLLHSPVTQQALLHNGQERWVNEVSEASLTMLDICGISKDFLLLVKDHLQDLQFTLRRVTTDDSDVGTKIAAYSRYRKKLKKETMKCLRLLKGMIKSKSISPDTESAPMDHNLNVVVDVLREVRVTTISVVESLLSLISVPWLDRKPTKGSLASMFMRSTCQGMYGVCDGLAVESAHKRLEAVEIAIEDLEIELECMLRRLIQTRVSLLNILTH